jgi:outer membrane autotransporter protein
VTAGLFGQAGQISNDARNETLKSSAGSAESDAWGVGASIGLDTFDFYSEVVGGWNFYDVSTRTSPGASGNTEGDGYFLSVEAGRILALGTLFRVIPQAQLSWIGTDIDSFTDSSGTEIAYESDDIALGRLGVALDVFSGTLGGQPLRFAGIVNYWQQFGETAQALVGGAPLSLEQAGGSIEAGAGFHWGQPNAPLHLHGELTYRETFNGLGEQAWNATIGARLAF